jgi:outer membrane protein OmpA-like peptidoglycan-associated protein
VTNGVPAWISTLLLATTAAAQPSRLPPAPQVPLREGLTIVAAYHSPTRGDYETIRTVTHVDARAVTVTLSTDEPTSCLGQVAESTGSKRSVSRRSVLRDDLERAHAYRQEFTACASEPEQHPGSTAVGVSTSVLQELHAHGQSNLSATTTVAGMVPGVLTRLEPGTVPFKVIVNDEPIEVAVVHARWHSSVGDREYWILDDVENPLVVRGSYNGNAFLEVVKLSFPTRELTARLERDLAKRGRATVYGIYFDSASDRIREESDRTLADIAKALQQNPTWSLAVEGYTDNLGGDAYNLALSKRRAAAVKQALVSRYKVDGKRLQTNGYGVSKPVETNDTLEGRARNRRVELVKGAE